MASYSIYRQVFLTIILALLYGTSFIAADIYISNPISSQLPPIAYAGKSYTFSLSRDTFSYSVSANAKAPSSPPSIAYNVEDLPSWLTFDATSLTFTGTPPDQDAGKIVKIPVEGTLSSSTGGSSGNTSASEQFNLPIINEPAPIVNIPIVKQLSSASSLGPSKMLAPDTIHLPLGWSFSIGLQGDTFTIPTGQRVYWSVNLANGSTLPDWLNFSPDSYDFYGVAPDNVGPQGEEYDVVITGSNRAGYGGTTQTFKLVVGSNALGLVSNSLPQANASVGTYFQYQIPIDILRSQGKKLTESDQLTVNPSMISDLSWLKFQSSNRTFYGIPPYDPYGNASSVSKIQIPITFTGANASNLTVNQTISIQPSLFTALQLPNVFIQQGSTININLAQFLRNTTSARKRGSSKRLVKTVLAAQPASASPNVSVSYDPENTSSWLHYDANTLMLNGQVPKGWKDRSQISLEAPENNDGMSKASFYLAFQGDNAMGEPSSGNGKNGGNGNGSEGPGLSKTAKVAIGACLGGVGAIAALIILFACCRRKYDNDFDQSRQQDLSHIQEDDEGTLTDAPKNKKWKKAIVIGRAGVGEIGTPSTAVPSPMPGFEEKMNNEKNISTNQNDLHSVVVVSPNGRRRNAMEEVEAPMQSRLISNLFGGHGKDKRNSKISNATSNGTGLGLSMGDSGEIDPFGARAEHGRIRHQRSRQSVNSQRSSWESDLFYEDAPSQQHSSAEQHDGHDAFTMPSSEVDDMPKRRGKPTTRSTTTGLNVRHRNTHINESPAFHAPDVFVPESIPGSNSSRSNLDGIGLAAMDSNYSMDREYVDSQTGHTPGRLAESDARILKARVMQVQRHSPVLHQGSNNPFATPSVGRQGENYISSSAAKPYHVDGGEAFDDAEDDDEWPASEGHTIPISRQYNKQGKQQNNRNSVMSAMTDVSQLAGVRAHYANEAAMEAEHARSPNPSIMDGASISAFDPRETVKPVMTRPQTPPQQQQRATKNAQKIKIIPTTPKTPKRAPGSSGSASGKYLPCPNVEAVIGHLLRFRMMPNVPPPLAGAPGSPGKRSGRTVRYELTMLDDRPHLAKYKNQWPVMMSDWLSIDTTTFEVEGVVPRIAELEQLGDCEIGLISTTRISGNPNSPERNNTPQNKRSSVSSSFENGGRASISNDEERTVVARARLVFQNAAPRIFVPKHGHAF